MPERRVACSGLRFCVRCRNGALLVPAYWRRPAGDGLGAALLGAALLGVEATVDGADVVAGG